QGNQHRLGAVGLVDRIDDLLYALQVVGVVGDDQRVAARIRGDGVVGRDQRAKYRHQLRGRLVAQGENLRLDSVASGARLLLRAARRARVQLGVGGGNDLDAAAFLYRRVTLHAQGG